LSNSEGSLKEQVEKLIKELGELRVELETVKLERDLWKEKFVDLSKTKSSESLSSTETEETIQRSRSPGTVMPENVDIDLGKAAVFIAKHPELPWKKGKEDSPRKEIG